MLITLNEFNNTTLYYTTSWIMNINKFIDIEVIERENYEIDDVNEWIEKYNITDNTDIIWVSTLPYIAVRYEMESGDWDNAEEIYNNDPSKYDIQILDSTQGFIITESDDGDDGFLFVFNRKM